MEFFKYHICICLISSVGTDISWLNNGTPHVYTNHFVAKVQGGKKEGLRVASDLGLRFLSTDLADDHAHFLQPRVPKISSQPAYRFKTSLISHPKVIWAQQQILRQRSRRNFPQSKRLNEQSYKKSPMNLSKHLIPQKRYLCRSQLLSNEILQPGFNDPYYPIQWYLHGGCKKEKNNKRWNLHLNVLPAWAEGLTGEGVTLTVLDDGVQADNAEIVNNYEARVSADLSNLAHPLPNPIPRNANDSHGTYCAGIMAAEADNNVCGVGVAYKAKVGGVRLLGSGPVSDLQEALALSMGLNIVDVTSTSWGPKDDGKHLDGPGPLAAAALHRGCNLGRQGRGLVFVWAVGNGGLHGDNCNLDGYASSIYTLTVSALTYTGETCVYSEPCASILASVFIGGPRGKHGSSVVVPTLEGGCRQNFQGTSAAAPMAAGIIALLLHANPSLGWRDVQHLVAVTSRRTGSTKGWRSNAAGLHFHLRHGFGAIDAGALVTVGRSWTPLPPQAKATWQIMRRPRLITAGKNTSITLTVAATSLPLTKLEHVEVTVTLIHACRGRLELFLISPQGTESQLLTRRHLDNSTAGFSSWPFMSVHFWRERPSGLWTFVIVNLTDRKGILTNVSLTLHGYMDTE